MKSLPRILLLVAALALAASSPLYADVNNPFIKTTSCSPQCPAIGGPDDTQVGLFPYQTVAFGFDLNGNWDRDMDIKVDLVGSFSGTAYLVLDGALTADVGHFTADGLTTVLHNVNLGQNIDNGFAGTVALYLTADSVSSGSPQGWNGSTGDDSTFRDIFFPGNGVTTFGSIYIEDWRFFTMDCSNAPPGACLTDGASPPNVVYSATEFAS